MSGELNTKQRVCFRWSDWPHRSCGGSLKAVKSVFLFQPQIDAQKYHDATKLLGKRLLNLNFADQPRLSRHYAA